MGGALGSFQNTLDRLAMVCYHRLMNINKAIKRSKKQFKNRYGHKVSNRSIFVVVATIGGKANKVKNKKGGKHEN